MKTDSLFYKYFQLLPEALLLLAGEDAATLQYASEYHFNPLRSRNYPFASTGYSPEQAFVEHTIL
ncbi:MAG: hypothetical protein MUF71_21720 [Candidatus Kapabacteria bacterium]|nr:hypothetical protein [Candidatus Kapabacteria bacterium]